jgi:hypothetical protein
VLKLRTQLLKGAEMSEKMSRNEPIPEAETGATITGDIDREFNEIIAREFETPGAVEKPYVEPFFVGRMALNDIGFDNRHRATTPSTNQSVTWTPKDDGSGMKVDAVTYGDTD